jgi:cation:H+ antiporter
MSQRPLGALAATLTLTIPWVVIWSGAIAPAFLTTAVWTVAISGLAVLGASFLLAWAAETAEKDVPRAFAIAVLAVLAVAPEYAVDALYAWNAGSGGATTAECAQLTAEQIESGATRLARACQDSNLAVANMTGANRILIGIGWAGIVLFTVFRSGASADPAVKQRDGPLRDSVLIDRDVSLEILFLLLATCWAFLVPINGGIDILDMLVLVGLYVAYIAVILRGDVDPSEEHVGVPAYLQQFPRGRRIATVITLFAYSGAMIFIAVEPFAHGLEQIGTQIGVPEFFMIQWIAPLASESPELIVVLYLVNKARSTAGFNALISSKLNQWTLLIGTLVVVYSLALSRYGALPFDTKQSAEIWLTAAQSFFAIAVLIDFEISVKEAIVLLVLFLSQVFLEFLVIRDLIALPLSNPKVDLLFIFTAIYLVLGVGLLFARRHAVRRLIERTAGTIRMALSPGADPATEE